MDSLLMRATITVTEATGEDALGAATSRITTHLGAFAEHTLGQRMSADGALPSGSGFVAIDPAGYGVTWSLKRGDSVTAPDGRVLKVLDVTAVTNPRTLVLHHIEASCG